MQTTARRRRFDSHHPVPSHLFQCHRLHLPLASLSNPECSRRHQAHLRPLRNNHHQRLLAPRNRANSLNKTDPFMLTPLHPFLQLAAIHRILKNHLSSSHRHRSQSSVPRIHRPPPPLLHTRPRLPRILKPRLLPHLPPRINPIRQPNLPHRLRQKLLPILRLLARHMIRSRRQSLRRHRRLPLFPLPNTRNPQQIQIITRPNVIPQIQHQPPRRQIVLRKPLPQLPAIQHRAKKREILLHKIPPLRLLTRLLRSHKPIKHEQTRTQHQKHVPQHPHHTNPQPDFLQLTPSSQASTRANPGNLLPAAST